MPQLAMACCPRNLPRPYLNCKQFDVYKILSQFRACMLFSKWFRNFQQKKLYCVVYTSGKCYKSKCCRNNRLLQSGQFTKVATVFKTKGNVCPVEKRQSDIRRRKSAYFYDQNQLTKPTLNQNTKPSIKYRNNFIYFAREHVSVNTLFITIM